MTNKHLLEKNLKLLKDYLPSVAQENNDPTKIIITHIKKRAQEKMTLSYYLASKIYHNEPGTFILKTDILKLEQKVIVWYNGVLNENEDMLDLARKLDSNERKIPKSALKKSRSVGSLADNIEILKQYLSPISQCDNIIDDKFMLLNSAVCVAILHAPTTSKNYTYKALGDLKRRITLWYDGVLNKNEDMLELAKKLDSPGIRLYVKQNISFRKKDCQPKNDNNKSTVNSDEGYLYNDEEE